MPTLQCLLFVSLVNIEKPCGSLHEQLLGALFLPATHTPTSGSDGAWTWLCAWLPAVAALLRLQLIPQPRTPQGPQRRTVCRADCSTVHSGDIRHPCSKYPRPFPHD